MNEPSNVDLQSLERIAADGLSSFGVLTGSLMQYNAFLLAAFAVIASTSTVCRSILIPYLFLATISLLIPLLSAMLLHKAIRRKADTEIRRLYHARPELFNGWSDKLKQRYKEQPTDKPPSENNTQWRLQEAAMYLSAIHTIVLCTITGVQYA